MPSEYRALVTGVPIYEPQRHIDRHGLVPREAMVARHLAQLGESSAEALAEATGLSAEELARALERLARVGYATAISRGADTLWVPLARMTP